MVHFPSQALISNLTRLIIQSKRNEWMNELYNLYPVRETRRSSPGVYSPAVGGN